jgi:hypothetical protein
VVTGLQGEAESTDAAARESRSPWSLSGLRCSSRRHSTAASPLYEAFSKSLVADDPELLMQLHRESRVCLSRVGAHDDRDVTIQCALQTGSRIVSSDHYREVPALQQDPSHSREVADFISKNRIGFMSVRDQPWPITTWVHWLIWARFT